MCFRGYTLRTASSCNGGMQVVFEFFRAMAVFTDAGDPLQGAVYLVERDDGGAGEDYAGCAIFGGNYFRLPVDRGVRKPLCKSADAIIAIWRKYLMDNYLAYATERVSRITVIFTCPG